MINICLDQIRSESRRKEIHICMALITTLRMLGVFFFFFPLLCIFSWWVMRVFFSSSCPSGGQLRYRREHASGRQLPFFPLLEDLMRDVCDGAALLTVVHCYCPDLIKLEGMLQFHVLTHSLYQHLTIYQTSSFLWKHIEFNIHV